MKKTMKMNHQIRSQEKLITEYIEQSIQTKQRLLETKREIIEQIVGEIVKALQHDNKVLWFGNGGSAADAQHLACELVSKFFLERKALASLALTTNTSELTGIANDYSFDRVFARQVEALARPGDIVIGITTSGNSPNVIEAIKVAKRLGAITVGFTGESGGRLKDYVDYLLDVPSKVTPHIQESHITIGHLICLLVEKQIFGE